MKEIVKCRFRCDSVTKRKGWTKEIPFTYDAEFSVVCADTEENKKFFAATPSGNIKVATINQDVFEVGKEYNVDFTKEG